MPLPPHYLFVKIQNCLTFLVPTYPDCPEKEVVKWGCLCIYHQILQKVCGLWFGSR